VCCSVLQCVAAFCGSQFASDHDVVLQCVAVRCSVLQCAAVRCSVLQHFVAHSSRATMMSCRPFRATADDTSICILIRLD